MASITVEPATVAKPEEKALIACSRRYAPSAPPNEDASAITAENEFAARSTAELSMVPLLRCSVKIL